MDRLDENIIGSDEFEETIHRLFAAYPEEARSDWMKSKFMKIANRLREKFKPLLALVRSREERRI